MIKEKNSRILQESCLHCHRELTHGIETAPGGEQRDPGQFSCVHCHSDVGHGETLGMGVLPDDYRGRKGLERLKRDLKTQTDTD